MKRRHWVLGSAGVAAAAAGVGWQFWRDRDDGAAAALWPLSFAQPSGGDLLMSSLRGQPLLLNFWATWCAPCIKEFPELDRFQRDYAARGWRVVGLAIDEAKPVREFLQRNPVSFTIGLAGFEGVDLTQKLGNGEGALPFTVVFDGRGRVVRRKLGPSDRAELVRWAESV